MKRRKMRFAALLLAVCWLALAATTTPAFASPPHFEHIIIVIQENRTPDNLFGGNPTFEQGVDIQRATGIPAPQPWCLGACREPVSLCRRFRSGASR